MTGPEGNSDFCETLWFEGNKIHCSPRDQSLSDLLYSQSKFSNTRWDSGDSIRPSSADAMITCNSGQHFAGNSELFPVWRHSFRNVARSSHWENKNRKKWQQNTLKNIFFTSAVRKRQQTLKWLLDFDWLLRSYDYLILIFYWFISAG